MSAKARWISARGREIASEMPDQYPAAYARYLAKQEWNERSWLWRTQMLLRLLFR
ncbi:hypothetical protein TIN4_46 [Tsukamurella phage TIN4]|uniref:Uncharacterized protein n=2 Tax=Tinduovirus TIN3 TaxID=1982571 RepID=A0A0K0N6A6_9CAUD|nr:hypothetical protein AVT54_gp079 [Tsukamurella phage TIN3]YP_009604176.1 hypothetical protein FDH87_gp079 [Tsukamurella phage TIN4]AKJ71843.1 hypothetical protein TIN3_46 [Tsukamurella phage TIN3]AKJ71952.1 hypothetical protein TIN4_46 [Tsukamurella phage TIN4]